MTSELGLGKVSKEVFRRSVQPYLPMDEAELDGATLELTHRTVVAHSPSIGVPLEALGFFAFHYAASNVASFDPKFASNPQYPQRQHPGRTCSAVVR